MTVVMVKTNILDQVPKDLCNRQYTSFSKDLEDFLNESFNTKLRVTAGTSYGCYNIKFIDDKKAVWFRLKYSEYIQ